MVGSWPTYFSSLVVLESASTAHSTHMKSWIGGFFRPFCFDVTWEFLYFLNSGESDFILSLATKKGYKTTSQQPHQLDDSL